MDGKGPTDAKYGPKPISLRIVAVNPRKIPLMPDSLMIFSAIAVAEGVVRQDCCRILINSVGDVITLRS